ncbi:S41 family peptidase [Aquimarina sp. SS2-1]|uniref:S41 family peptidase n=1 Tax=Aquimarina besae TaxID=3342247 RepID=UPI0036714CFB
MKFNLFSILLLFIFCFSSCKEKETTNESLNRQAKHYIADYDELVATLTTEHPTLYEFTSKENFDKKVIQLRSQINNSTSKKDFIWILSELIATVGCGHTSLGFFNQQRALLTPKEYFPLLTRFIDQKLYVVDNLINEDTVNVGDEITQINGKSIAEIMDTIYAHINSQASIKSSKKELFNGYNTSYLAYALDFPETYTIKVAGSDDTIVLKSLENKPPDAPLFSKKHPCQKDFCLTEANKETALLTLRNFAYYGRKTEVFTDFLDDSFKEIKDKGYTNLIIDVRGNLGGPGAASIHLLKHTLQKPFKYFVEDGTDDDRRGMQQPFENNFNGKIAFVMNGLGNSTVGHLASVYKDKRRVVFIGETLGSNQFCTANQKQFQLTHTDFHYSVARNVFVTDVQEKNTKATITPDIKIEQSIEDYLSDKDVVLEKALELMEE